MEDKDKLKRAFQVALCALGFQILLLTIFYLLYAQLRTPLLLTEIFHIGVGIPIFSLLFLLFHQRYKEALEKEEVEELKRKEGTIFKDEESTLLISRLRLKHTERWIIPPVTFILSCMLIYIPIRIIMNFEGRPLEYEAEPVISLLLIGLTFFIFLFARYLLGMSKVRIWKEFHIISCFLGVNALFVFLIAVSMALTGFGILKAEWFVFYILNFLLIIIGIEYFLNIISSFYRPKGAETSLPFDSKIFYFLSVPEEVIPSFSQIVDYQFGFRITQTWFYQFLKRRFIPLVMLGGFLLYILTSIVIVRPYQRAFIEFLGKPVGEGRVFGPGLYFKFPYPIGRARIYDVERVKGIRIGVRGEEGERFLWTERHYEEEFNWIIPSREAIGPSLALGAVPVNFITGAIWIYYQINPDKLFDYAYKHSDPENLLKSLVYNQFTEMIMGIDFFEMMNVKRLLIADTLKKRIQKEADRHNLGVNIIMVNLGDIHPPVEVALSFERVLGAIERKKAYLLEAEAHQNRQLILSQHEASSLKTEAESYKYVRALISEARGEEFRKKLEAFHKNPRIFRYRYYLTALEKGLTLPQKYIVISPGRERIVTIIDLEEGVLPDILSLGLEAEKKEMKK